MFEGRAWFWGLLLVVLAGCGGGGGGAGGGSTGGGDAGSGGGTGGGGTSSPQVISTSPASGEQGVALESMLTATFNESINGTSAQAGFQLYTSDESPVFGNVTLQASGTIAVFSPDTFLDEYTEYTAIIQVSDSALNPMPSAYEWSFRTEDLTAPNTTASVAAGLYNTQLNVTLSCDDGAGSGCASTYYSVDGTAPSLPYAGGIAIGEGETTLRFYSEDNEGQAEPVQEVTYTVDLTPPELVQPTTPATDATEVPRNTVVSVTFSEAVNADQINSTNFYLDNGMPGTVSYDAVTYTATLTPAMRMECDTSYQVTLASGISDLAGNTLPGDQQFSFTVTSDCTAPATVPSVAAGRYDQSSLDVSLSCTDAVSGCARILYTVDGSTPSLPPLNGTLVEASSSGVISLPEGISRLRYYAEDHAGNAEPVQEELYLVSSDGLLYAAADSGLMVGTGPNADDFERLELSAQYNLALDDTTGRLWGGEDSLRYSDDMGASWHRVHLDSRSSTNVSVQDIAAQGSRVALATGEGVILTDDSFGTYVLSDSGDGLASSSVNSVVFSGNNIFALSSSKVFVSHSYGETFEPAGVAEGLSGIDFLRLETSEDVIFASGHSGLAVSTDQGQSFTFYDSSNGLGSDLVYSAYSENGAWYVLTGAGVSVSADQGATFSNTAITMQTPLEITAQGANVFVVARESFAPDNTLFVSHDGGATFGSKITTANGLRYDLVTEVAADDTHVVVGGGGGVSVSLDGGMTFSQPGLSSGAPTALLDSSGRLFLATLSGLSFSDDGGITFQSRGVAHGLGSERLNDLALSSGAIYAATDNGLAASSDNGSTFTTSTDVDGLASNSVNALADHNGTLYVGTDLGLSRPATKGGKAYESLTSLDGLSADRVENVFSYNGSLYVTPEQSSDDFSISANDGASWTVHTIDGPAIGGGGQIRDLYVDASGIHMAIATVLAVSTDGGTSFSMNPALDALSPFNTHHIDKTGSYLYVGASNGLAISPDAGSSFVLREGGASSDVVLDVVQATLYLP